MKVNAFFEHRINNSEIKLPIIDTSNLGAQARKVYKELLIQSPLKLSELLVPFTFSLGSRQFFIHQKALTFMGF